LWMGLLAQTAEPAKEVLGVERIAVVADRGYFKIEDIEACEKAGIDPYMPRPQRGPSVRAGLFRNDEFRYNPTSDSFLCPAGQRLHPYSSSLMRGLKKVNYRNSQACRDCPIRSQCTGNQFRAVSVGVDAVLGVLTHPGRHLIWRCRGPVVKAGPRKSGSQKTCMGLFRSSGCFWVLLPVLCSERERPFFIPSPAIRFPERAEGVKGPKR
jgi:hypothetical protein